jgi:transcriptional regulator with XRE-family HTH domain
MGRPVHDLTTFGGLLADLRERRGLSQHELAESINWYRVDVTDFDSGTFAPTRDDVAKLATGLSLDADDTGRLYVAAGLLPPGNWAWVGGWCIRPASDMSGKEETTNAVQSE